MITIISKPPPRLVHLLHISIGTNNSNAGSILDVRALRPKNIKGATDGVPNRGVKHLATSSVGHWEMGIYVIGLSLRSAFYLTGSISAPGLLPQLTRILPDFISDVGKEFTGGRPVRGNIRIQFIFPKSSQSQCKGFHGPGRCTSASSP